MKKNNNKYWWLILVITCLSIMWRILYLCKKGYDWIDSGFDEITWWDIFELAVIPLALAFFAYILDNRAKKADRDIQRERLLQNYFNAMTSLILDNNLMKSNEREIREIARVKTLTTLKSLDGDRKGALLQFLNTTGLLKKLAIINEHPNN